MFVHIPKTGGTSVRNAAAEFFGEASMLYDYGPDAPKTSQAVRDFRYDHDDPDQLAEWIRTTKIAFISGHFKVAQYTSLLPEADAITWVRDPVARVESLHRHRAANHGNVETLDEFSANSAYRNGMVDQAGADLSAYAMVGVLEHQTQSIELLNTTLNLKVPVRHDNSRGMPTPSIKESLRLKIENRNRKDADFVAAATKRINAS